MGIQDAVVGLIALVVAALVVRRLTRAMRPAEGQACPKCASGESPCQSTRQRAVSHQAR